MKDWILLILASCALFDGLTNLLMVRAVRKHLKATTDLAESVATLRTKQRWEL